MIEFFFLIIKSTLRALLLNSDIPVVKMSEALIIIPRYLNSWTISNPSLSNTKWCFFINLPLLLNIKIFVLLVLTFSFHFCSKYSNYLNISANPLSMPTLKQDHQHTSIH